MDFIALNDNLYQLDWDNKVNISSLMGSSANSGYTPTKNGVFQISVYTSVTGPKGYYISDITLSLGWSFILAGYKEGTIIQWCPIIKNHLYKCTVNDGFAATVYFVPYK